jgi:hypothetical protein
MRTLFVAIAAVVALALSGIATAEERHDVQTAAMSDDAIVSTTTEDSATQEDAHSDDVTDEGEARSLLAAILDKIQALLGADDDATDDQVSDDVSTEDDVSDVAAASDESTDSSDVTQSTTLDACDATTGANFGEARSAQVHCYLSNGETPPPAWTHPLHPRNAEDSDEVTAADEASTEEDTQDESTQDASTDESSTEDASTDDAATEDDSTNDTSTQDASTDDTSTSDEPADDTSAQDDEQAATSSEDDDRDTDDEDDRDDDDAESASAQRWDDGHPRDNAKNGKSGKR